MLSYALRRPIHAALRGVVDKFAEPHFISLAILLSAFPRISLLHKPTQHGAAYYTRLNMLYTFLQYLGLEQATSQREFIAKHAEWPET